MSDFVLQQSASDQFKYPNLRMRITLTSLMILPACKWKYKYCSM